MATATADDIALARRWASFYRSRGMNVLPSRMDEKRPMVRFAEYWNEPTPGEWYTERGWSRFNTPCLQVMTGRRWRLLVIDLDGPEARDRFATMGRVPATWATHSGGDGLHLWFSLPELNREIPKAILWRGEGKHEAIERLCDRSLVIAPPSIHPKTGKRYRFASKFQSPAKLPMPAPCPAWILQLPPIEAPRPAMPRVDLPQALRPKTVEPGRFRMGDVLDAIHDKISLAESWGLRVASHRANSSGWCSCHAAGREDRNPSASISEQSGRYWEPGERTVSLFDLAVRLGAYLDVQDAVSDLGRRFRVREVA